jgi:hypothetical protein
MNEHPLPWIVCIMSGVFGAVFLVAFFFQFDPNVVAARKADEEAVGQKPTGLLRTILSVLGSLGAATVTFSEYRRVWAESKGTRFLVPLGIALCLTSYFVHQVWLRT